MTSINPLNVQMSSETASLKLLLPPGGNSFVVPSASSGSPKQTTATVNHNYGNDNLIWQVGFTIIFSGGGTTTGLMTPYSSGDGQTVVNATLDSNNLYITGYAQTAGLPTLQYQVNYYYRIIIP